MDTTTGPRVTVEQIEAAIVAEHYFTAADGYVGHHVNNDVLPAASAQTNMEGSPLRFVTCCVLILKNGHRIVGVNEGPVSAENFSPDMGREYAREQAVRQVWPLLGYELRSQLAAQPVEG